MRPTLDGLTTQLSQHNTTQHNTTPYYVRVQQTQIASIMFSEIRPQLNMAPGIKLTLWKHAIPHRQSTLTRHQTQRRLYRSAPQHGSSFKCSVTGQSRFSPPWLPTVTTAQRSPSCPMPIQPRQWNGKKIANITITWEKPVSLRSKLCGHV